MSEKRPFKVGDEVVLISGSWGRYISGEGKVSKVYKNGNFVLEGDNQQYRPNGYATGDLHLYRPKVVHKDDSIVRKLKLEMEFNDVRVLLESEVQNIRNSRTEPTKKKIEQLKKALGIIRVINGKTQKED